MQRLLHNYIPKILVGDEGEAIIFNPIIQVYAPILLATNTEKWQVQSNFAKV